MAKKTIARAGASDFHAAFLSMISAASANSGVHLPDEYRSRHGGDPSANLSPIATNNSPYYAYFLSARTDPETYLFRRQYRRRSAGISRM